MKVYERCKGQGDIPFNSAKMRKSHRSMCDLNQDTKKPEVETCRDTNEKMKTINCILNVRGGNLSGSIATCRSIYIHFENNKQCALTMKHV